MYRHIISIVREKPIIKDIIHEVKKDSSDATSELISNTIITPITTNIIDKK
jgi:hypothetical protein